MVSGVSFCYADFPPASACDERGCVPAMTHGFGCDDCECLIFFFQGEMLRVKRIRLFTGEINFVSFLGLVPSCAACL